VERIKIKMVLAPVRRKGGQKASKGGPWEGRKGRILLLRKSILLFLRARAGLTYGVFFFIINRV
jgi:hypothetical protein